METKPLKFINITYLVIAIPLVNFLLFMVYYFAYPELGFWTKLWNYLSSAVFTLVTGSLIIPLLFAILEKRYKFIENIQKQREDKRKQVEDQKRQNRQQAINETIEMWQNLFNLTSEVMFFTPSAKDPRELSDLIIRLHNFTSSSEHIVNKWSHQFPNLTFENHDVFLEFINILFQSGLSIAYFMRGDMDEKERKVMQNMLLMIQDQIKTVANHGIINILKYSAKILEMEEAGEKGEDYLYLKRLLKNEMDMLSNWAEGLRDLANQHDNFLAPAEGLQIDEIRSTAKKIESWLKEDKMRQVNQSEHFKSFHDQYYKIPLEERVGSASTPYTKQYIRALADWLSMESACNYIYSRAHHTW